MHRSMTPVHWSGVWKDLQRQLPRNAVRCLLLTRLSVRFLYKHTKRYWSISCRKHSKRLIDFSDPDRHYTFFIPFVAFNGSLCLCLEEPFQHSQRHDHQFFACEPGGRHLKPLTGAQMSSFESENPRHNRCQLFCVAYSHHQPLSLFHPQASTKVCALLLSIVRALLMTNKSAASGATPQPCTTNPRRLQSARDLHAAWDAHRQAVAAGGGGNAASVGSSIAAQAAQVAGLQAVMAACSRAVASDAADSAGEACQCPAV